MFNQLKSFAKRNVSIVSAGLMAGVLSISNFAHAAADPNVASTATSLGTSLQENLLSGLTTVIPIMVAVGVIFWVVRFAYKKIAGRAH